MLKWHLPRVKHHRVYLSIRRLNLLALLEPLPLQPQILTLVALPPAPPSSHFSPSFISQNGFIKSFCKSRFRHKSVNLSFIITNTKNKATNLCGNWHLQNDSVNTFRGILLPPLAPPRRRGGCCHSDFVFVQMGFVGRPRPPSV